MQPHDGKTIVLFLVAACCLFCNRHKTLPAARCQVKSDCINGESCVDGTCVFTDSLSVEIKLEKIYAYPTDGDLIVEAAKCRKYGLETICRSVDFRKQIRSFQYQARVMMADVPRGEYLVTACIDLDGNGRCAAPDLGARKNIKTHVSSMPFEPDESSIMVISYPLADPIIIHRKTDKGSIRHGP